MTSQGKCLEQVTRKDWEVMLKGLYDWIRGLQSATGTRMTKDERLNSLMYAYGKRRPLKFVLLTVISKSHKKRLKQHLSDAVYHAHVLVYGYKVSVVVGLIKHYWANIKGYAKSEKAIHDIKCYDDGKLVYNLAQKDIKPKVCTSPVLAADDLNAMYYSEFASLERFNKTKRIETEGITKAIQLYGKILVKNGYSATVKGRWLAGIKAVNRMNKPLIKHNNS